MTREAPRPRLSVAGETFYFELEAGVYFIRHDRWSLIGSGESLFAAYKDLLAEAREIAPVLRGMPIDSFDENALGLYNFAIRFA